jgi:tetratricopeptide (TPR) repeat protein
MLKPEYNLQRLNTQANKAIDEQDYELLRLLARQMLAEDPMNSTGWSYFGVSLSENGEHADALDKHRNAIRYDRESATAWKNYAVGLSMAGDFNAALAAVKSSVALDEFDFYTWRLLLECHLHVDMLDEADRVLDKIQLRFRKLPDELGIRLIQTDQQFSPRLLRVQLVKESSHDFTLRAIGIEGFGETLGEAFVDFSQTFHGVFADFKGDLPTATDEQIMQHAASRVALMRAATEEIESDEDLMAEIVEAQSDDSPAVSLEQLRGA